MNGNKKRSKRQNAMMFLLRIAFVLYIFIVLLNLFINITGTGRINHDLFTILIIAVWTYGILCSNGYFKRTASKAPNGVITYTTNIPIVQIGFIRVFEFLWFVFLSKKEFNLKYFFVCVAFDLLLVILLLIDKSSYYYESVEEDL